MRFRRYHLIAHSIDVALQRRAVRRLIPAVVLACLVLATTCLVAFIIQGANDHRALNGARAALNGARTATAHAESAAKRATTALRREETVRLVQERGLKARPYLIASMCEIGQLLTYQSPQQKAGPPVPPAALQLLVKLRANSLAYATVSTGSQQPSC